jgi:hypothetical protein
MADAFFSSSWRILEPCGCARLASFILPRPSTRRKRLRCLCSRVSHRSPVKSIPPQSANASSMTGIFCEGRSRSDVRRGWRTAAARCSANQQGYRGHSAPKAFERREKAHVRPRQVDLEFGPYPDQPTKDNYRCLRMMEVVSSVDDAGELVGALHAPARLARDQQATVTHVGPLNGFHGSARTWRCDYHIHAMRHVVKQRSGVPRRHGTRRPKCRTPYTRQEAIARQARWSSQ